MLDMMPSSEEIPIVDINIQDRNEVNVNEASQIDEVDEYLKSSSISNPYFSYDTTLIPYIESLYEEIPNS